MSTPEEVLRCWDCGELTTLGACYYVHRSGAYRRGLEGEQIIDPYRGRKRVKT